MSKFIQQQEIILASASAIRGRLLESLGLEFSSIPSDCDEEAIKNQFATQDWPKLGFALAEAKAKIVSQAHPNAFVIAADQLCVLDNQLFDKPLKHEIALKQLQALSGKTHRQIACLVIAKEGEILWRFQDEARLTMQELSPTTIEAYLKKEKPYHSCGSFQYETEGKWLFREVEGHVETILGLPLLPLTQALFKLGAVSFIFA